MSGPIVSLSTLEKIVPEHCRPLWRNDTNLMVISKYAREKECGDTHAGRKKLEKKRLHAVSDLLQQYFDPYFPPAELGCLTTTIGFCLPHEEKAYWDCFVAKAAESNLKTLKSRACKGNLSTYYCIIRFLLFPSIVRKI